MKEAETVDEFVIVQSTSNAGGENSGKRRRGGISRRSFSLHLLNVPGSELFYSFVDSSTSRVLALDIEHVMVPEAARGFKVAERLVKRAFDLAAEHGVPIIPSCTYVSNTFLSRYDELRIKTMTIEEVLASSVTKVATKRVQKRRKLKAP